MAQPDPGPLHVVHVVNQLDGGGTERALIDLLHAWAGGGVRHTVVALREEGERASLLPPAVPVVALRARGASRLCAVRLAQVVRRLSPDVLHARGLGTWTDATLAGLVNRTPALLLGFHGMDSCAGFPPRRRRWARWFRRTRARYVSVSYAGRDQLQRELGLPPERIEVIPNGVDSHRFHPPDARRRLALRAEWGFATGDRLVGTVGSLHPVKDHATFLAAVAMIPRTCRIGVVVVGDGPLLPSLREQSRCLGLEDVIRFLGRREDVPDVLGAMDVYVCSSRYEGMSNAVLEAMATRLPVIATDVGDQRSVIDAGRGGQVVPVADPRAMGETIARLLADPDLRRRWGEHARRRAVEEYPFTRTVRRHLELYWSLVPERVTGPAGAVSRGDPMSVAEREAPGLTEDSAVPPGLPGGRS